MIYDVCVIGGGPAGVFSAYYSASRGLSTLLIEGDSCLGGRINYYLDYAIYDIPGLFGIQAREYKQLLVDQLYKSDAVVMLNELVYSIDKIADVFHIKTQQQIFKAETVISAVGNGYVSHKPLKLHQMTDRAKPFIQNRIESFELLKDKKIAIIGHTPLAVDWANQCKLKGVDVTLFASQHLNLQPILMNQLDLLKVPVIKLDQVDKIDYVTNQFLFDAIRYDHVFVSVGTTKHKITHHKRISHVNNGTTDCEGYFVAGDCRYQYGKLKLIHGATHDAMQAVNEATLYLKKDSTYQPIVSTHEPIFKQWDSI